MALGVVVSAVGLHVALALVHIAATTEATHLVCGVERAVVGVHHSLTIHNLDKVGVERCGAVYAVVRCTVAIGVGLVLVDKHIAEALEALV